MNEEREDEEEEETPEAGVSDASEAAVTVAITEMHLGEVTGWSWTTIDSRTAVVPTWSAGGMQQDGTATEMRLKISLSATDEQNCQRLFAVVEQPQSSTPETMSVREYTLRPVACSTLDQSRSSSSGEVQQMNLFTTALSSLAASWLMLLVALCAMRCLTITARRLRKRWNKTWIKTEAQGAVEMASKRVASEYGEDENDDEDEEDQDDENHPFLSQIDAQRSTS